MVTLVESIDINAAYAKLHSWVNNLENEFVLWSPYHTKFELTDHSTTVGSRLRFTELVEGLEYDISGIIIENHEKDGYFRFKFRNDNNTAVITFEGIQTQSGCRFTHTEEFGVRTKLIGTIVNFLLFKVLFKKKANWRLIQDDMIRDNLYLKTILEEDRSPSKQK